MTTKRSCHELGVCHGRPSVGRSCRHDTHQLPPGGFYFAPGAIEQEAPRTPRARRVRRWMALAAEVVLLAAISIALGVASGWFHAKGLL